MTTVERSMNACPTPAPHLLIGVGWLWGYHSAHQWQMVCRAQGSRLLALKKEKPTTWNWQAFPQDEPCTGMAVALGSILAQMRNRCKAIGAFRGIAFLNLIPQRCAYASQGGEVRSRLLPPLRPDSA